MLQALQKYIAQKKLCKSTDKILVTVSGGLDSMVLLDLLREAGYKVGVAHCNFQLRGRESDEDEQFVRGYCNNHHLPFFYKRFETNNYATAHKISIQMAARELRYVWFEELLIENKYDCVATAHHASDNAETVLLNLTKGSGVEGLVGIQPKNRHVIRPMLFATRDEIHDYAAQHQITWREDMSNSTDDYQRNFIRHKVIPALKQVNPVLEDSINRSVEKLLGVEELADVALHKWENEFVARVDGKVHLSKKSLSGFVHPVSLLYRFLKQFGFNLDQCKNIFYALDQGPGKKFSSPEHELVIDREDLIVYHAFGDNEVLIEKADTIYSLGTKTLRIQLSSNEAVSTQKNIATLDADKVTLPLIWRRWKSGDVFYPLGMPHKKKLSDFFINEKLSLADKESATVVESAGQIIWVVGYRLDDRFKMTSETQHTMILESGF